MVRPPVTIHFYGIICASFAVAFLAERGRPVPQKLRFRDAGGGRDDGKSESSKTGDECRNTFLLLPRVSVVGSAQTLQGLQTELGLPFKFTFGVTVAFFDILGIACFCREHKNQ